METKGDIDNFDRLMVENSVVELFFYEKDMIVQYKVQDGLRHITVRYEDIAFYQEKNSVLTFYREDTGVLLSLLETEPMLPSILEHIGRDVPTFEEWLASVYGEAGEEFKWQKMRIRMDDIAEFRFYENYVTYKNYNQISVIRYEEIVAYVIQGFSARQARTILAYRRPDGKVRHLRTVFLWEEIRPIEKYLHKKILSGVPYYFSFENGLGKVHKRLLARYPEKKPKNTHTLFSAFDSSFIEIYLYEDEVRIVYYQKGNDEPKAPEAYTIPYADIVKVGYEKDGTAGEVKAKIVIEVKGHSFSKLYLYMTGYLDGREAFEGVWQMLKTFVEKRS